jgi:hypothetical protein
MKKKIVYIISILVIFSAILTGCDDGERVAYNKVIVGCTLKEFKEGLINHLVVTDGSNELNLTITNSDVASSLDKYIKYKTNTDGNDAIKLNVMYNTQNKNVVGISPPTKDDTTVK